MASSVPSKLILNSSSKISLNDRFSKIDKQRQYAAAAASSTSNETAISEASEKNRKLALQIANRPSVQAALKLKNANNNKPNARPTYSLANSNGRRSAPLPQRPRSQNDSTPTTNTTPRLPLRQRLSVKGRLSGGPIDRSRLSAPKRVGFYVINGPPQVSPGHKLNRLRRHNSAGKITKVQSPK
jgi:hypothetical protein